MKDPKNVEHAESLFGDMTAFPEKLFHVGSRNNDCVNFAILCHVLGKSWLAEYEKIRPRLWFSSRPDARIQNAEITDRFWTIDNYLPLWGPEGEEDQALSYMI